MLASMLGDLTPRAFLDDHMHRVPYTSRGGASAITGRLTWEIIAAVLRSGEPLDVLSAMDGALDEAPPRDLPAVRARFAEGWTFSVRHAERHEPGLAELAASYRRDFAAPVDVHVHATPAGHEGFGWHYDVEDVFIVITQGRKRFGLRRNTVLPWPTLQTMPRDLRHEQEISPILECELAAGDWVYVPPGWWHVGQALEDSLSLAIGIASPTALDLVSALREPLSASLIWRQRLPVLGELASPEADAERWALLLEALGTDFARSLADDELRRAALDALRDRE